MDLLLIVRGLASIAVVFWHGFGAYHVNEISPLINIPGRTAVWIFFWNLWLCNCLWICSW